LRNKTGIVRNYVRVDKPCKPTQKFAWSFQKSKQKSLRNLLGMTNDYASYKMDYAFT